MCACGARAHVCVCVCVQACSVLMSLCVRVLDGKGSRVFASKALGEVKTAMHLTNYNDCLTTFYAPLLPTFECHTSMKMPGVLSALSLMKRTSRPPQRPEASVGCVKQPGLRACAEAGTDG